MYPVTSPNLPLARAHLSSQVSSESDGQSLPLPTQHLADSGTGGADLEASLIQHFRHHHHTSLVLRDQAEKAKKEAIRNAGRVSDLLVDAVNGGVQESFINQKRIELEIRALASTLVRFTKQTDQWHAATHAINSAIKLWSDHAEGCDNVSSHPRASLPCDLQLRIHKAAAFRLYLCLFLGIRDGHGGIKVATCEVSSDATVFNFVKQLVDI